MHNSRKDKSCQFNESCKISVNHILLTLIVLLVVFLVSLVVEIYDLKDEKEILQSEIVTTRKDLESLKVDQDRLLDEIKNLQRSVEDFKTVVRTLQLNLEEIRTNLEGTDDDEIMSSVDLKERLPQGDTNMFCCMDWRKITDTKSVQYTLQSECVTNSVGLRIYAKDDTSYFTVALGSAYGRDIGDAWTVTLNNGTQFNIMLGDFKDDGTQEFFGHPCKNYDDEYCTNVIEFIIHTESIPDRVKTAGTFTALDIFGGLEGDGGNIYKLDYLGRVWNP